MASTVIVRHTGGYCEMRLTTDVKSEPPYGTVYTLEFFFMDPETQELKTEHNRPTQTFGTAAEAWLTVGQEVGWWKRGVPSYDRV